MIGCAPQLVLMSVRESRTMSAEQNCSAPIDASVARQDARVVPGRSCGTCTLCCKAVGVVEIAKPGGVWCRHCVSGKRCTVYETRYVSCRTFYCEWMVQKALGPEWKPDRAKFVLANTDAGRHL